MAWLKILTEQYTVFLWDYRLKGFSLKSFDAFSASLQVGGSQDEDDDDGGPTGQSSLSVVGKSRTTGSFQPTRVSSTIAKHCGRVRRSSPPDLCENLGSGYMGWDGVLEVEYRPPWQPLKHNLDTDTGSVDLSLLCLWPYGWGVNPAEPSAAGSDLPVMQH
ncbi:hypothetical protein INR49_021560 [Caranx melampygus]|nr:hypothetical protein INR49_021560 [Caranx melampygus]